MAAHRKSIIKASLDRLEGKMAIHQSRGKIEVDRDNRANHGIEGKMAIHQSRGKAKDAARESGESIWHSRRERSILLKRARPIKNMY